MHNFLRHKQYRHRLSGVDVAIITLILWISIKCKMRVHTTNGRNETAGSSWV